MSNASIVKGGGGTEIAREGFGERSLERRRETASTAVAAQAQATIQARYIVARQNPRNWDDVRVILLKDCGRTSFADRALYSIERGTKRDEKTGQWVPNFIEGLTIRFAEAVIRTAGNVLSTTRTTYDDEDKRILNVSVTDLESNAVYERDLIVEKTVERKSAKGRVVLDQRSNSFGDTVYIVVATEDEVMQKEGVAVSKAVRTLSLRFLPADITEECVAKVRATVESEVAKDPDAARKTIADAFAGIGIKPSDLAGYMGQALDSLSPAQLHHLRGVFAGIQVNEFTWAEALAEKTGDVTDAEPAADGNADAAKPPKKRGATSVAERIKKRQEAWEAAKAKKVEPTAAKAAEAPKPAPAPTGEPEPPFGALESDRQPGDDS